MNLVIVESPTKARTISKFLGKGFLVESSFGHIRDLPKSKLGIDLEKNFEPQYIIPVKSKKRVNFLKKEAQKSDEVILAVDEDREGEAIAWHLVKALGLEDAEAGRVKRIVFHEITESAINEALKSPRAINTHLVNAQQARRILDRLVGYKLSPFLWEKVMRRLSAGRVQSVALRLIAEREEEIKSFKPDEYWTIVALLNKIKDKRQKIKNLEATVHKINGKIIQKLGIQTKEEADAIVADLKDSACSVLQVDAKKMKRNPLPPFTTSTLQQEASKRLRLSAKQTMRLAQMIYENGFITYMRTDSVNLSMESVTAAKKWLLSALGPEYAVQAPRFFKTKSRLAQEAHEAIRPTNPGLTPEEFKHQFKEGVRLYELIWQRFMASQMPQAIFDSTSIEIEAKSGAAHKTYGLRASGSTLRFDGFLKIWPTQFEEKELPDVKAGEELNVTAVVPSQHFTEPPPRYNEASLIKILEEYGIGRPSTYAPIISVIQERNYVTKNDDRRFVPTEIGFAVNKILVEHFPKIVDIQFTAKMEEELDLVAAGKAVWQKVIQEFYEPFAKNLEIKYGEVEKQKPIFEETNEVCEKCGKPMIIKYGRFGKFLACSGFPECKNTKTIRVAVQDANGNEMKCSKCSEGFVVRRRTKRGRFFYGCSRYPACDFASWTNPALEKATSEEPIVKSKE